MFNRYPEDLMKVHLVLHNPEKQEVLFRETIYQIHTHPKNEYRYVILNDGTESFWVAQQNLKKASPYADRARRGERISWIMPKNAGWERIDKATESKFPGLFINNETT